MPQSVTISSTTATGEYYEITLSKIGPDTGTIEIKLWLAGVNHHAPPSKDDTVQLYDIRSDAAQSRIVCRGNVFGPDPTIDCTVRDAVAPRPPSVRVVIAGTLGGIGDSTKEYEISPADYAALRQFIAAAGFPPIGG